MSTCLPRSSCRVELSRSHAGKSVDRRSFGSTSVAPATDLIRPIRARRRRRCKSTRCNFTSCVVASAHVATSRVASLRAHALRRRTCARCPRRRGCAGPPRPRAVDVRPVVRAGDVAVQPPPRVEAGERRPCAASRTYAEGRPGARSAAMRRRAGGRGPGADVRAHRRAPAASAARRARRTRRRTARR